MSARLHPTADQMCAAHGISRRMFFNALKVRRTGCPEVLEQVENGSMSINLALQVTQFDVDSQRLILEAIKDMAPRKQVGFVRLLKGSHIAEVANAQ